MHLFEQGHVLVPRIPVAQSAGLGDDALVQQFVAHAFDAYRYHALAYLSRRFLAVQLGSVQWLHRAQFDALARVAFSSRIREVVSYGRQPLVMSHEAALSQFYSSKSRLHESLL